jgi:hypothetical protein
MGSNELINASANGSGHLLKLILDKIIIMMLTMQQ